MKPLQAILRCVTTFDEIVASRMLSLARFLTRSGSTRGENLFWRLAAIAAAGGAILALFGEVIGGLSMVRAAPAIDTALLGSLGFRAVRIYLLYRFIIAMAHGLKEPFGKRNSPK
jgi:hypothetical protein